MAMYNIKNFLMTIDFFRYSFCLKKLKVFCYFSLQFLKTYVNMYSKILAVEVEKILISANKWNFKGSLIILYTFFTIVEIIYPTFLYPIALSRDFMNLPKQDRALIRDLILINYPPSDWRKGKINSESTYDVVIIGAGMAGLAAGAALYKEGIFHIKLFDQASVGLEGPWVTYARMKTLRSSKDVMGPALEIPHLTFHAWFEALFGAELWKQLEKIPNELWMEYLNWYRQIMGLSVENHCKLIDIIPIKEGFELRFDRIGQFVKVKARKVILATGRAGFGGPSFPKFIENIPKSVYAHTTDQINFESLKGRRIGIIGVGASSFDAAAAALEAGAESVDLIMRRDQLPNINKFSSLPYKGFNHGYFKLNDEMRWNFMCEAFKAGIPPPIEALKRVEQYTNLRILSNTNIFSAQFNNSKIQLQTNRETYSYDFLILGTGFHIDGRQQTELRHVIDQIALWKDRLPIEIVNKYPKMGCFPYLGPSFEFLPKEASDALYLKNLYCFNYGATLSHGLLSSDIPGISIGATRLAQGIAADFFLQDSEWYLNCLKYYQIKDFEQKDYLIKIH